MSINILEERFIKLGFEKEEDIEYIKFKRKHPSLLTGDKIFFNKKYPRVTVRLDPVTKPGHELYLCMQFQHDELNLINEYAAELRKNMNKL